MKKIILACHLALVLLLSTTTVRVGAILEPEQDDDQPSVLIYQVQYGSELSAKSELIVAVNPTENDINVTNWCVRYMSASGLSVRSLACVEAENTADEIWLGAGGFMTFASSEFAQEHAEFAADYTFSAGMSNTGGHVLLEDEDKRVVDTVGWGSATKAEGEPAAKVAATELLTRNIIDDQFVDTNDNSADIAPGLLLSSYESALYEVAAPIDLCVNLDGIQTELSEGVYLDEGGNCVEDFCPNIEGLQLYAPDGYEKDSATEECLAVEYEDAIIEITELLPNVTGYDSGYEFIELYNPNQQDVNLEGYTLAIGPEFTKTYVFDAVIIEAKAYLVLGDNESGITLPNTNGAELRLFAADSGLVSSSQIYADADEDESWSVIDGVWQYTNQVTDGDDNIARTTLESPTEVLASVSTLSPCPEGKYRNPLTNRCKSSSTTSTLTPCAAGQYRNPDTNRCRKIATSSSLVPCNEGQERNPETNRCRNVLVAGIAGDIPTVADVVPIGVEGSANWGMISLSVMGVIAYMSYEWRVEALRLYGRLRRQAGITRQSFTR